MHLTAEGSGNDSGGSGRGRSSSRRQRSTGAHGESGDRAGQVKGTSQPVLQINPAAAQADGAVAIAGQLAVAGEYGPG